MHVLARVLAGVLERVGDLVADEVRVAELIWRQADEVHARRDALVGVVEREHERSEHVPAEHGVTLDVEDDAALHVEVAPELLALRLLDAEREEPHAAH